MGNIKLKRKKTRGLIRARLMSHLVSWTLNVRVWQTPAIELVSWLVCSGLLASCIDYVISNHSNGDHADNEEKLAVS